MRAATIARFTLQEAVSRRLVLAGVLISVAYLGLFAFGYNLLYQKALETSTSPLARVTVGPLISLLTVLGLYVVYFLAGFLALFLSVGTISGEIDSGTLHAVLARPLRRSELVLGRWIGYALLLTAYVVAMTASIVVVARVIAGFQAPDFARATGLMALGVLILMTVSLLGSTLLSTLANGVIAFTLLGLAWLAGMIGWVGGLMQNDAMVNLGTAVSLLLPSDALWRGASYYLQPPILLAMEATTRGAVPFTSATPPTPALVAWSAGYLVVALAAAVAAFRGRDL